MNIDQMNLREGAFITLAPGRAAVVQGAQAMFLKRGTLIEAIAAKDFTLTGESVPLRGAKLMAPIPRPPSMRDGYAFRQHVESARKGRGLPMIPEFDLFPVFYFTNHNGVVGPGDVPVLPKHLERLDFELEIAIVIGRRGRNIPAHRADEFIFGYTIMNDWSARGLQTEEMKLSLGPAKGKDFATALGPVLVRREDLLKSGHLKKGPHGESYHGVMKAFHNGKQVSEGNANTMNWTFAQIIERASYGVTLEPGDVIGSGTVGTGCYMELNVTTLSDHPVWVKAGDVITLVVDGLGSLENRVVLASEELSEGTFDV
jgi:fumarylacetoacetate (FAA) hydrolase